MHCPLSCSIASLMSTQKEAVKKRTEIFQIFHPPQVLLPSTRGSGGLQWTELAKFKLPAAPALSQTDSRLMRNWDNWVRQGTVRQQSMMTNQELCRCQPMNSAGWMQRGPLPSYPVYWPGQAETAATADACDGAHVMTHGTHAIQMMCPMGRRHLMMKIWHFNP